ncbi:unnamed protein product [Cyclocybe aegerita]|uniref:C3H1-type domain-containing protein n=1 Tax=Cyclocybe aegerita TaxID=1973307 RepID=A0A8S0XJY4_CYCAE|nr:unnamed protein product [Cyclocybe aegerita]
MSKMPMRCRAYDDSGIPIGRGCSKGLSCNFVHPDDQRWGAAIRRYQNAPSGPPRFARDRNEKRTSSLWDPDPQDPPATSTNATPLADSSSRRVSYGSDRHQGASNQQSYSSVKSPAWDKVVTSTPPARDKKSDNQSSGWSTGWSSSAWGERKSSSGWDTGTGWDNVATNTSTWGGGGWNVESGSADSSLTFQSKMPAGGESNNETAGSPWLSGIAANKKPESRKGKERAAEDVHMREPSPRPWGQPPPAPAERLNKPDLPPIQPDAPHRPHTRSPTPTSSSSFSKPANAVTTSSRHDRSRVSSLDLKKSAVDGAFKASHPGTMTLLAELNGSSRASTPTVVPYTRDYRGSKGRVALHKEIVQKMQNAVILQVQRQRAEDGLERWKRTQISDPYKLCPPGARKTLDSARTKFTEKDARLQKRLLRSIQELADLPDLAEKHQPLSMNLTKEVIASYTRELGEWFKELQLHKRLVMEEAEERQAQPGEGEESPEDEPEDTRVTGTELCARGRWSWSELNEAVARIEDQVSLVSEEVYAFKFTNADEALDVEMEELREQLTSEEQAVQAIQNFEVVDRLVAGASIVGDQVSAQALRAAELIQRTKHLEDQIEMVVAETAKMNQLCAEAEQQFKEFEHWKESDTEKIQQLTEKLKKLYLHKRVNSSPPSPRFSPVTLEVLLEHFKPVLLVRMHEDLSPVFKALRDRCFENQERAKAEIDEMVKPALKQTDEICQRVLSMTVSEASAQLS